MRSDILNYFQDRDRPASLVSFRGFERDHFLLSRFMGTLTSKEFDERKASVPLDTFIH